MAGNYTSIDAIEGYLARELDAAQTLQAESLLDAADAWINAYTKRVFGTTTAVVGELHDAAPFLHLERRPVATIQNIHVREHTVGATLRTLVANVDYELLDPARGLVAMAGYHWRRLLLVDYTPSIPLDPRVALAATKIVAAWLSPSLGGAVDTSLIKRYSIGQELQVEYRDDVESSGSSVPSDVPALLAPLRKVVFA